MVSLDLGRGWEILCSWSHVASCANPGKKLLFFVLRIYFLKFVVDISTHKKKEEKKGSIPTKGTISEA